MATAAVLVIVIALAAAGAFDGCRGRAARSAARPPPCRLLPTAASPTRRARYSPPVWAGARRTRGARSTPASSSQARSSSTATSRCWTSSSPARADAGSTRPTSSRSRRATAPSASSSAPTTTSSPTGGQGYTDNATGVGLLLEVGCAHQAHVDALHHRLRGVRREEDGLLGAQDYVRSISDVERRATIGMIDLDAPAAAMSSQSRAAPAEPPGSAMTPSAPPTRSASRSSPAEDARP